MENVGSEPFPRVTKVKELCLVSGLNNGINWRKRMGIETVINENGKEAT